MRFADLLELGLVLALAVMAIAGATFAGVWMKGDTRHSRRRGRR